MAKLFATVLCALAATAAASPYGRNKDCNKGGIIYNPDAPTYDLAKGALSACQVPFSNHSIDKPFGSYLQMSLDFAPFKVLFGSVNATVGTLKSRGEAHITIVTPPEFDRVLKPAGVTIKEIEQIALKHNIQCARLKPACLGRFQGSLPNPLTENDKGKFTLYSLVVDDYREDLVNIRRDIYRLYRKKGGEGALFQAEGFWPHVTLGFDRRDLFIEDGIYKGTNFCYAPIKTIRNF
ncbi:hypothetical protein GGI12_002166 [Dipsacomyces acuminosporus]|nr:hypothetical protein GGI12_002166 [Dipsacomyces acuminosporus]